MNITRPRTLEQRIPSKPDLAVCLPETPQAAGVGGSVDMEDPHRANHLIVGNLGLLEVVLIAFDDGDVMAFYAHELDHMTVTCDPTESLRTCDGKP